MLKCDERTDAATWMDRREGGNSGLDCKECLRVFLRIYFSKTEKAVKKIDVGIKRHWPLLPQSRIYVHSPGQFLTETPHTYYDVKDHTYNEIEMGYEVFEMVNSKKRKCFDYDNQSRDECVLEHIEKVGFFISMYTS